jgi:hypothetical protein
MLAQESRQKRVEPFLEPSLLHDGLLTKAAERAIGRRQCRWRDLRLGDDRECEKQHGKRDPQ